MTDAPLTNNLPDALTVPTLRRYIDSGLCPVCEAGPFVSVSAHTYKAHGISAAEIRARAGLSNAGSICDPALSERMKAVRSSQIRSGAGNTSPPTSKQSARGGERSARARHYALSALANRFPAAYEELYAEGLMRAKRLAAPEGRYAEDDPR